MHLTDGLSVSCQAQTRRVDLACRDSNQRLLIFSITLLCFVACAPERVTFLRRFFSVPSNHVLIYCSDSICLSVYTVAVQVSNSNQNFSLQVDMGSSDLVGVLPINRLPCTHCPSQWIASTSCSSSACSGTKGRLYDPSISGVAAGFDFNITYLAGDVIGPVYWDQVQVGGYSLSNQALGAPHNHCSFVSY